MRLFVAVDPAEAARDHLAAALAKLHLGAAAAAGGSVGLAPPERWHLTLAFLGDVPQERVDAAAAAVGAGVARWREAAHPAPRLRLAGAGRFGRRRFTVLWCGLDGDIEELRKLAREVRRMLRGAGMPYDDRKPFRPHLTVARPGERLPPADIDADLAALAGYQGPWWRVQSVSLIRSRLGPKPAHEPLATAALDP